MNTRSMFRHNTGPNRGLLGREMGLQSKRASGQKLLNPCIHTDN